jgi:hypothetical protein
MQKELEVTKSLASDDLKSLADATGPCLTFYLPVEKAPNTTHREEMRLKSAVQSAEQGLRERNVDPATIKDLLDPLPVISSMREHWGNVPGGTLVVLRSKEIFRAFEVSQPLGEAVHVAGHFQVRPIFKTLQAERLEFYLLALSQKHVRLLRCDHAESTEVPLPGSVPTDLEAWLSTRMPDTEQGTVRPADGSTGGSFTSTTDVDRKDEHLANFYRVINKAVFDLLKDETLPLVLCGVEYERSIYQSINSYAHLLPDGVQGSPQSLKGGEMHKRAREIVLESAKQPVHRALGIYEKLGGTERVSTDPEEIVKAAHQSRIAFLFAGETASFNGRYDPEAMKVRDDGMIEDLVNVAMLRTIAYGGEAFIAAPGQVPGQGPMAAIYRF